jgi:hypothetical protein
VKINSVILILLSLVAAPVQGAPASQDCVVLLHGLARTSTSMIRLETHLKRADFSVVNIDYPSRDDSVQNLADDAVSRGLANCEEIEPNKIHFVTHSLGGILVRFYFQNEVDDRLGRVVMLGPPNGGSEVVDAMNSIPGFGLLNGPSGDQLGTTDGSMPRFLGPVDFELGVIAGNQSINPIYAGLIPGEDDGKVSVESTRVEGMNEHLILPVTHTWMMFNSDVIEQTIHFLKTGAFFPQTK